MYTTMLQNQPASGISSPVRGAGYVPLANGTILTPQQVQEMISYMQARTPDYGEGDLSSFLARSGSPISRGDPGWNPNKPQSEGVISRGMQGWERGMSQDAAREAGLVGADILGGRNINVFDIAGDQYKTPQGGYGNGQGDAGFHYGLSQNPDGTFTVNSSDYSGGYAAQRKDIGSTFNLGEFLPQAGMLAAIAAYAPQLAAQMGGGAIGGAGAGAISGMGSAAVTGQDVLKGGLLGGLGGGIGGYASGLEGGRNFVGPMPDSVLPSTAQLVKTGGSAAINMLAGQDPTQALAGAGLNLAGITGNNTLKDAGLDPRLAGVATSAGLGLLTGRDPSSIALSSLPALGSYAGGLLGSSNGTSPQSNSNLSNSAEGGYASPMTGGDSPDTTGANNMGFDWTKILRGGLPLANGQSSDGLANIFGAANQSDSGLDGGIDWSQLSSLNSGNGDGLNSIINGAISSANNGNDYTDPFSSGSITGVGGFNNSDFSNYLTNLGIDPSGINLSSGGTASDPSASGGSWIDKLLGTGGSAAGAAGGTLLGGLGAAGLGAALGSINGAKQSGTSVTTTEPWSAQQPYLKDLFAKAQSTYNGQPSINPLQTQALSEAGQSADPTAGWFGAGGKVGTNPYAGSNPYLQQSIDYANEDTNRAFMPLMNQANHASGSFGNSGVADYYSKNLAEQFGRNSTTARMQDYTAQQQLGENDINRRYGAAMNTPTLANQTLQNSQNKFNLGTSAQNQPYDALKQYGSLITGNYGQTSSSPVYTNPLSGLLGGAVAGSSVYKNLFGS